jgi:hypothetical protein
MINLANVLRPGGPFSQPFVIQRASAGTFVAGGYQQGEQNIPAYGAITVAKERDLKQVPEADRVEGSMLFLSVTEIKLTHGGTGAGTSDLIVWRGDIYRIAKVWPYADYGFWRALGVRTSGQ